MPAAKKTSKRPRRKATIKEPEERMTTDAPVEREPEQPPDMRGPQRMQCEMCGHTITVPAGDRAPAHCRRCGSGHGWRTLGTEVRG